MFGANQNKCQTGLLIKFCACFIRNDSLMLYRVHLIMITGVVIRFNFLKHLRYLHFRLFFFVYEKKNNTNTLPGKKNLPPKKVAH